MKVYVNKYYGVCATTPEQAAEEILKKRYSYNAAARGQVIGAISVDDPSGRKWVVAYTNCWGDVKGATLVEYEVKGA